MSRSLHIALAFSGALFLGSFLGAKAGSAHAGVALDPSALTPGAQDASPVKAPANDPARKKAGAACKSDDECQRHHSCVKVGDQSVCKAPPSHLPPGAVT